MNRIMSFLIAVLAIQYCMASLTSKPSELPVILSSSQQKPHLVNVVDPAATLHIASGSLTVNLDNTAYSSYSIRLTPSDGGEDIVVPVTSSTMTLPITNTTTDYVITVDGGDYGTYDGVFSPSGHSDVTLSDTQAMQLVKNRRDSNHDINVYTATVNSLVNDPHYCRIDSLPNYTWATDNSAKKLIL